VDAHRFSVQNAITISVGPVIILQKAKNIIKKNQIMNQTMELCYLMRLLKKLLLNIAMKILNG
jgi:hypothetical protein